MKHRQFLQSLAVISATLFCSTHLGAQVVKAGKKKAKSVRSSESLPTGLLCNHYNLECDGKSAIRIRDAPADRQPA